MEDALITGSISEKGNKNYDAQKENHVRENEIH